MTKAPRTRAGQTYPGGKTLRRALANLHRRINGIQPGAAKRPDRITNRDDRITWGQDGMTKPGSMKA